MRAKWDYSLDRIPHAVKEHKALIDDWLKRLLEAGLVGFDKYMGMGGTAHALGSMVTGDDPKTSVVDPHGKVHGMENLYVGDGSPLPRASRVNRRSPPMPGACGSATISRSSRPEAGSANERALK